MIHVSRSVVAGVVESTVEADDEALTVTTTSAAGAEVRALSVEERDALLAGEVVSDPVAEVRALVAELATGLALVDGSTTAALRSDIKDAATPVAVEAADV